MNDAGLEYKRGVRKVALIGAGLFVLFILLVALIAGTIVSEIAECGGVAQCLGESVKEFDEARKAE